MTADRFRELALALDGAEERAHMGHPDFRAHGRIFAGLDADERIGTLKLTPDQQAEMIRQQPDAFTLAAGAWGRQGWTKVSLGDAAVTGVRTALLLAYQAVMEQPKTKARKRPGPKRR